ncbi:MAG: ThiF family adenylyltransferase [Candidatus Thermoplasmatota archaeon]|nr:ThiF family adenylyltransferase [Candidatus Thermoplasmatota archaeon]
MIGKERYNRQIILKEIGEEGQKKLLDSSVAVIGCGALGNVIANNLARAGVGRIKIVDRDFVELNNLQRQSLFEESDIGKCKALVTEEKLRGINSEISIEGIADDVNPVSIEGIIKDMNLVLDATDNLETRFLINDVCIKNKIPWVYGGAVSTYGMSLSVIPNLTPCLRCVFPEMPEPASLPTCELVGVLNTIPTIIGSIEATEALKILIGDYEAINKNLLIYDAWRNDFKTVKIQKNEKCKCCVEHEFEFLTAKARDIIRKLRGVNAVQIIPVKQSKISLEELASKLEKLGEVKIDKSKIFLEFKINSYVLKIFWNARTVVYGTGDEKIAKSLCAKYVGT